MNWMKMPVLLLMAIAVYACSDSPGNRDISERSDGYTKILKTREDSLYNEVMEGHDIGMARIGKLRRQINAVQTKLDSVQVLKGNAADRLKDSLTLILQDLKSADAGMNLWMDEFQPDSARGDESRRINYLENEKLKVEKVRDQILNSLQRADSILK